MWSWFVAYAEPILALLGIVSALGGGALLRWVWRMFVASRSETKQLISTVQETARQVALMRSEQVSLKTRFETMGALQWAAFATSTAPTFQADALGNVWRINRALVNLAGRPAEELHGRGWELMIHPIDRDGVVDDWQDAVSGHRGFEGEFRVVTQNTKAVHQVRVVATPLFCDAGLLTGYFGQYEIIEGGAS